MIGKCFRMIIYHLRCFFSSLLWLQYQIRRGNFCNYLRKEEKKKKLIILATGPSLKEAIEKGINDLPQSDLCVVNEFCKHPMFEQLKPAMYILTDPLYFCEELMGDSNRKTIHILSQTKWNMAIYVPFHYYRKVHNKLESDFVHVYPYHCHPYNGWTSVKQYLYRRGLTMPVAQNVLVPSIFNGINLGYSQIELYGVDHSWTKEIRVNASNQVCLCDHHFYDQDKPVLSPWKKCEGMVYKMHEILRDLAWMFDSYHQLRIYADSEKCRIINMTQDSFIDAFERGNHD